MVEACENELRVFALSHREFPSVFPAADSRYVKVQCGASSGRLHGFQVYDDEPGCMSEFNWCFSEATGIMRVAADDKLWSGCGYIGFCHYRRYLDFEPCDLDPDAVLCSAFRIGGTVMRQYAACHPLDAYVQFLNALRKLDRDLAVRIDEYFSRSSEFYRANCFTAPRAVFAEYAAFVKMIWPIMSGVVKAGVEGSDAYDRYQKRYMSFLFERLTSFWLAIDCKAKKVDVPLVDLDVSNTENGTR